MDYIEDIVRTYVPLVHGSSSKGWNSVYCEVCGDGHRTKGPRGGWLFDGEACFYSCFNCGISGNFDPNRDSPHSKDMYKILRAFNVPVNDINALILSKIKDDKKIVVRKEKIYLPNITPPDFFSPLTEFPDDDILANEARYYLWENYKMTQDNYPFFLSTGKTKSTDSADKYLAKSLRPRIIIPAYQRDRMIFWQARLFVGESTKKYISATVDNSNSVVYGLNNVYDNNTEDCPLYITEGFFDSWHVHGIAVISNTMKSSKVMLLERNRRPKVVIPDYNMDGMHLADQAVELGWGVALPEILPCTDLCKAINHFGKLYVIKSITENTYYSFEAKLRLQEFKLKNRNFLV